MSIQYCHECDLQIDTDFDAEHFEEHKEKETECSCCGAVLTPMQVELEEALDK